MGDGLEPVRIVAAEIVYIVVVGPGVGCGDTGVLNVGLPMKAESRVDEGGVDTLFVKDLDSWAGAGETRGH